MIVMFAHNLTDPDPVATPLPHAVCDQFHIDGMVHLPGVFTSKEIVELRNATRMLASQELVPTEHLSDGFRSWRSVTTASTELAALACDPRLVGIAVRLLGPSIRLVGTQLIHRHPHRGPRTSRTPDRPGWHRDIYGMHVDLGSWAPPCAIKCAIWLTDADTLEHGATRYVLGSHRHGLPPIPDGEIDPLGWVSPSPLAGDVTVFENRTAHAGGLNTSLDICEFLLVQYGYRWLAAVTNRRHADAVLDICSPLALQLLEPNDCLDDGVYRPGTGASVIAGWASRWKLYRYLQPPAVAHAGSSADDKRGVQ